MPSQLQLEFASSVPKTMGAAPLEFPRMCKAPYTLYFYTVSVFIRWIALVVLHWSQSKGCVILWVNLQSLLFPPQTSDSVETGSETSLLEWDFVFGWLRFFSLFGLTKQCNFCWAWCAVRHAGSQVVCAASHTHCSCSVHSIQVFLPSSSAKIVWFCGCKLFIVPPALYIVYLACQ